MLRAADLGLPGELRVRIGRAADYRQLARFHYAAGPPASFALVGAIDYLPGPARQRAVAVGVLSYPALNCRAREEALRLGHLPRELRWQYLNRHLRTISRVIVHPQFRGVGLSSEVVRFLLAQCPTRYVEVIARMGSHHPLFTRAGMERVQEGPPAYFLADNAAQPLPRDRSLALVTVAGT